jgi:hypothetical protein
VRPNQKPRLGAGGIETRAEILAANVSVVGVRGLEKKVDAGFFPAVDMVLFPLAHADRVGHESVVHCRTEVSVFGHGVLDCGQSNRMGVAYLVLEMH